MNRDNQDQFELLNQLLDEGRLFGQRTTGTKAHEQEAKLKDGIDSSQSADQEEQKTGSFVIETRPDAGREKRKGAPEIIFGETKEVAQIIAMAQGLLTGAGRAIISRLRPEMVLPLRQAFVEYRIRVLEAAHAMVIYRPDYVQPRTNGRIGLISAGTSDIPVADEAALIAEEMGCQVIRIYDVGVAGLHRLLQPLRDLLANDVDVIIVAAGMDGALPSVVTGLVPVPVIGLPTSVGYGLGGKGVAALLSMLQTCAPGLSVVNIDNGVGAGITAALIANRAAQAREH